MSITVQAWMDRLRQRVQEGSIVFNPVSGSDFFRRLYMNQPPPAVAVRMEARREPIPLTDMEREECRRIGERMARMMDQQLMDAFSAARSVRPPGAMRIRFRGGSELEVGPITEEQLYGVDEVPPRPPAVAVREICWEEVRREPFPSVIGLVSAAEPLRVRRTTYSLRVTGPTPERTYKVELVGTDRHVTVSDEVASMPDVARVLDHVSYALSHPRRRSGEEPEVCGYEVDRLEQQIKEHLRRIFVPSPYRPFSDGSRRPCVPFTPLPTCAQCGKTGLKQTYTSTRDQREICADCFEGLQDKGLAREQGQPMKKKARHPLDAWMDQ